MGRTSDARERLIRSAIELIHARSYADVGVNELCEHAGVKKGSFYHFFPSKSDLIVASLDEVAGWYARDAMIGMGLGEWFADAMTEYFQAFSAGYGDFTTPVVERLTGHPARSYEVFARDFAQVFGGVRQPVA